MKIKKLISKYHKLFSEVIKTKTFTQTGIVFVGTFINGLLGAFFYILLARFLGPSDFGIFSVSILALTLVADIGDLGTDTGIVRFVGSNIKTNKNLALKFLKLGLEIKIFAWLIILVTGVFIMPYIANVLLVKPELVKPFLFILIGVGGGLLFSFVTHSLQAMEKFWVWSGVNIAANAFRLFIIILLALSASLSLYLSLTIYMIIPFVGFLISLVFLPKFFEVKGEKEVLDRFLNYNKWVAFMIFIAAFSSRLDTFLSTRLLSLAEVGIYSVAVSLSSIIPQIVFAFATVVAPKMASMKSDKEAKIYIKKLLLFVIFLSIGGTVVGLPLALVLIPIFYGHQYMASFLPFAILFLAQMIFFISVPIHSAIFYYFSNPKIFSYLSIGNLLIILIMGWYFIGLLGIKGAALAVLLGNLFNFLIPGLWILKRFKYI